MLALLSVTEHGYDAVVAVVWSRNRVREKMENGDLFCKGWIFADSA
jgi:hypothetical protein